MTALDTIDRARAAFARHAWTEASELFRAAEGESPLSAADLEDAGLAAYLLGDDDDATAFWSRAHQASVAAGDLARASRQAFWIGMFHMDRGEMAVAGGWLGRATRLLEAGDLDCVERGYVLVPEGLRRLDAGNPASALSTFDRVTTIADRFEDPDLTTLGRLGRGLALIAMTDVPSGVALLDEAMVALTAGEVSPIVVGMVYCASIDAFQTIFDLRRAQEWTDALQAWVNAQPDLVPFRGRCLVYRAEMMQFHGTWPEAIDEARRAQELLSRPPPKPAVGEALYQQAELHRLRGEFADAEAAYRAASRWGRRTEPGLALLRLAQGRPKAASAAIRRAIAEAADDIARARLLGPHVEIALALGDHATAREAADALVRVAAVVTAPLLTAIARQVEAEVLLAAGDARAALAALREASTAWEQLDAPYEMARVRVGVGLALRELGDADSAELEFDAARQAFRELGAAPDLARVDALTGSGDDSRPGGLSPREVEVLRAVAVGRTNREIGAELGLSERTIDRHVSNIYTKLGVSSRAAATAYAYEHGLR